MGFSSYQLAGTTFLSPVYSAFSRCSEGPWGCNVNADNEKQHDKRVNVYAYSIV